MQVFLIGFMGSGKTYWGLQWSQKGKFSFFDLDEEIEKKEKKSVTKIFEENGENYFRDMETAMLHHLADHTNTIIACGGGTPCFNENMEWMNKNGITIYLKASPEYLAHRLHKEKQKRPLIKDVSDDDLVKVIEQKIHERESFYNQSKIILDVETNTSLELEKIINS